MGRFLTYAIVVMVFTTVGSWARMFNSFGPSTGSGSGWSSHTGSGGGSYGGGSSGGGHK